MEELNLWYLINEQNIWAVAGAALAFILRAIVPYILLLLQNGGGVTFNWRYLWTLGTGSLAGLGANLAQIAVDPPDNAGPISIFLRAFITALLLAHTFNKVAPKKEDGNVDPEQVRT